MLGHYAGKDEYFTPEAVRALEAQLKELGKDVEMHVYEDSDHAFFNDTRPEVYDKEAAEKAWSRTIEFLHSRLG